LWPAKRRARQRWQRLRGDPDDDLIAPRPQGMHRRCRKERSAPRPRALRRLQNASLAKMTGHAEYNPQERPETPLRMNALSRQQVIDGNREILAA
jgi:hypothetical protein